MKVGYASIFILLCQCFIFAQDCDCKKMPYDPDPPCFDICVPEFLSAISKEELEVIIGVSSEISKRIIELQNKGTIGSIRDIEKVLTIEQLQNLKSQIKYLSEGQIKYFNRSTPEREGIKNEMKDILNEDDIERIEDSNELNSDELKEQLQKKSEIK